MSQAQLSNAFKGVLDASFEAIVVHKSNKIWMVNKQFVRMMGDRSAEDYHEMLIWDLIPHRHRRQLADSMATLNSENTEHEIELDMVTLEEMAIPIKCRSTLLGENGEQIVLTTFKDLRESKAIEARMVESDRLETLGTLAAGVVHEINNPLTYLSLCLDELNQSLPSIKADIIQLRKALSYSLPPIKLKALEKHFEGSLSEENIASLIDGIADALVGSRRISEVVSDLKVFSHMRDSLEIICLNKVIKTATQLCRHEVQKRANLNLDLDEEAFIRCDEGRIIQVLINLLTNAADAIPPERRGSICISMDVGDFYATIKITDDGCGIPPAVQTRLFEPFYTTKGVGKGTGLGLSISKKIIEEAGGDMTFETELNVGSTFVLTLPIDAPEVQEETPRPLTQSVQTHRHRVMVIEDEEPIRRQLYRVLSEDFIVQTAPSGRIGFAKLQSETQPDLILTDLLMADGTGMDLYWWLDRYMPHLCSKLVYLTAGGHDKAVKDFLEKIPNLALEKPIAPQVLIQTVKKLCDTQLFDPSLEGERRTGLRKKAQNINGRLYIGTRLEQVSLVDFSCSGIRAKRNGESFPYQKHSLITLRLQNKRSRGEVAAHVRFARYAETDPCFEFLGMSSRDKEMYNTWLALADV